VWHTDVPQLRAMSRYWASHPPLHILVAGYLGFTPAPDPSSQDPEATIQEAAQHMPVNNLSATEFDELLRKHGLTA